MWIHNIKFCLDKLIIVCVYTSNNGKAKIPMFGLLPNSWWCEVGFVDPNIIIGLFTICVKYKSQIYN